MKSRSSSIALVVLLAFAGHALLILLSLVWLRLPDAHAWQLAMSLVLAIAIVLGWLWLETYILRAFAEEPTARRWMAMLVFAGAVVVGWGLLMPAQVLEQYASPLSYYWNSELPRSMRYVLPQPRLLHLLQAVITGWRLWLVPGLLLPFAAAGAVYREAGAAFRAARHTLRRPRYWLLLAADVGIAFFAVTNVMEWQPAYSVRGQVVSLAARTAFAYLVCVSAWLIAVRVACVRISRPLRDAGRDTSA